MKISSSNIGMESAGSYSSFTTQKTSVFMAAGGWLKGKPGLLGEGRKNTLTELLNGSNSKAKVGSRAYLTNKRDSLSVVRDKCMQHLLQIFFGETIPLDYGEMFAETAARQNAFEMPAMHIMHFSEEAYFEESESASFSAKGTVRCADGREISIDVNVGMSRSFRAYYEHNYTKIQPRMCDPLVINFNGDSAELQDQTFFFDIDADGTEDEISMLGSGSGYLALDKNGDGVINDGNELFGTKSGNGFSDLAAYDSDGNGWIDENDAIWEKLLIWTKDEKGNDKCYKLSEKGVGAICLSSAATDFSLNAPDNRANGKIRRTGFFLYENGNTGTVQHLDLVKHQEASQRYENSEPFFLESRFNFAG